MAQKVKSFYCEVCGAQRRFTKETGKSGGFMARRAYKEMNPMALAASGMLKAGRAATNAGKSYRCATCGSKQGAKPGKTDG